MAGISRSATIIIAYLMRKSQLSMVEAYTVIKRIRTIVT
jgi:protein-tyrosine phosphatase